MRSDQSKRARHLASDDIDLMVGEPPVRDSWRQRMADRLPEWVRYGFHGVPVRAVIVVLVVGLAFAGVSTWLWWPEPAQRVQVAAGSAQQHSSMPAGGERPTSTPANVGMPAKGSPTAGVVVVHVVGQVKQPGVVQLSSGARVSDAIQAAGGVLEPADTAAVNFARVVKDGEQVVVPKPGESLAPIGGKTPNGAQAQTTAKTVNLNNASPADLDALPGIGPALAARIIQHREKNGPFRTVDDLSKVSGIGPALLSKIRDQISVE